MLNLVCSLFVILNIACARRIVDLTHTFDMEAPKYPLGFLGEDADKVVYFNMTVLYGQYMGDFWLTFNTYEFYEHQGTHIDAPAHFGKGRQTADQIPAERLIGPGVVIDVRDKVKNNSDYAVTVEDLLVHEQEHGKIPPNAIVHMNSGWAYKYPNASMVFGTENISDSSTFHFPGWSTKACEFLLQKRQINVLCVDTPSIDPGQSVAYPCHIYLQNNEVPLLEYAANLDSIPVRNTTMVLGVAKLRHGSGGPTRTFAIIDDDDGVSDSTIITPSVAFLFTLLLVGQLY